MSQSEKRHLNLLKFTILFFLSIYYIAELHARIEALNRKQRHFQNLIIFIISQISL